MKNDKHLFLSSLPIWTFSLLKCSNLLFIHLIGLFVFSLLNREGLLHTLTHALCQIVCFAPVLSRSVACLFHSLNKIYHWPFFILMKSTISFFIYGVHFWNFDSESQGFFSYAFFWKFHSSGVTGWSVICFLMLDLIWGAAGSFCFNIDTGCGSTLLWKRFFSLEFSCTFIQNQLSIYASGFISRAFTLFHSSVCCLYASQYHTEVFVYLTDEFSLSLPFFSWFVINTYFEAD